MAGIFVLSLDCEGKWGLADQLTPAHNTYFSEPRLRDAYATVVGLLDSFDINATFAFTSLFTLTPDELSGLPIDMMYDRLPYTRSALRDFRNGLFQGWSAPWARDMVKSRHEIGCHGVTHTPWDCMDDEQAAFELSLVPLEVNQTFVFPRNRVGHLPLLARAGFKGYRCAPKARSRVRSLMSEFAILASAEPFPPPATPLSIPAGYFINWRSGLRQVVPATVTRMRVRHILEDAVRTNGVAHFWTHPENIASAPATATNFRIVLEEAARLRAEEGLVCLTQAQYCDHITLQV